MGLYLTSVPRLAGPVRVLGTTPDPSSTSGTMVLIPEMTAQITTRGNLIEYVFECSINVVATVGAGDVVELEMYLDNEAIPGSLHRESMALGVAINTVRTVTITDKVSAAPGAHTFEARWKRVSGSGSAKAFGILRKLTVTEIY